MDKHLKELLYISLLSIPIILMFLSSALTEVDTEIPFEIFDRKIMLISNSMALIFLGLPYFAIRKNKNYNMNFNKVTFTSLIFVFLLTLLFVIVDSPVVVWNKSIVFPEFLSSFETWAKLKESQLEKLTIYLVSFDSFSEYLIGIIAIALIPGFFEEFLFRGIIQKNITLISKNHHLAIWLSALIFSAIHMQFYGFFPRLLMGRLFGYLFYWSGSILYAVAAHAFNNFFSLTIWYSTQLGFFGEEYKLGVNDPPDLPIAVILLSLSLFLIVLYFVRQKLIYERENKLD
jgi:membrane protease YdiL (CAAX protease family)